MKLTTVKFGVNRKPHKRLRRYARAAAAEEFGPRYWGWSQWDRFRDYTPAKLNRMRAEQWLRTGPVSP